MTVCICLLNLSSYDDEPVLTVLFLTFIGRNGLEFDSLSGWLVMNIPDLLHGKIVIKMETWHKSESNHKTEGWTEINNNETRRVLWEEASVNQTQLQHTSRVLKKKPPELCQYFQFQYAINGNVTSMNKEKFLSAKQNVARVVEMVVLLDEDNFTGGVETEVEVAVRMVGCGRHNVFKMSHIYWA